jgi:hypothetical protein
MVVGSSPPDSSAVSPAPPDWRPDGPASRQNFPDDAKTRASIAVRSRAELVRSAAGRSGLEPGMARPEAELDSPKTK